MHLVRCLGLIALTLPLAAETQTGAPAVRHKEGASRGFLILRDLTGKTIAAGDLTQTIHSNRLSSRLTFHFRDGSVDDETTVYTQDSHFHLVSDHHIQRGPSFPKPEDVTIDMAAQQVTSRDPAKSTEPAKTEHVDLPPELANGLVFTLVRNLLHTDPEFKVPYLAYSGKSRIVHLDIMLDGEEPFRIGVRTYKAQRYAVRIELGGITGVIAPMVGKQPPDIRVWMVEGTVPATVRVDSVFYNGGPVWSIQLATPSW